MKIFPVFTLSYTTKTTANQISGSQNTVHLNGNNLLTNDKNRIVRGTKKIEIIEKSLISNY